MQFKEITKKNLINTTSSLKMRSLKWRTTLATRPLLTSANSISEFKKNVNMMFQKFQSPPKNLVNWSVLQPPTMLNCSPKPLPNWPRTIPEKLTPLLGLWESVNWSGKRVSSSVWLFMMNALKESSKNIMNNISMNYSWKWKLKDSSGMKRPRHSLTMKNSRWIWTRFSRKPIWLNLSDRDKLSYFIFQKRPLFF